MTRRVDPLVAEVQGQPAPVVRPGERSFCRFRAEADRLAVVGHVEPGPAGEFPRPRRGPRFVGMRHVAEHGPGGQGQDHCQHGGQRPRPLGQPAGRAGTAPAGPLVYGQPRHGLGDAQAHQHGEDCPEVEAHPRVAAVGKAVRGGGDEVQTERGQQERQQKSRRRRNRPASPMARQIRAGVLPPCGMAYRVGHIPPAKAAGSTTQAAAVG